MDDQMYDSAVAAQVAMCQSDTCQQCWCDLGGGTCSICEAMRNGTNVCGNCGREFYPGVVIPCPTNGAQIIEVTIVNGTTVRLAREGDPIGNPGTDYRYSVHVYNAGVRGRGFRSATTYYDTIEAAQYKYSQEVGAL